MSHFYGVVKGQARTEATRRGSKNGGLETTAASWSGAISVRLWVDCLGRDRFTIEQKPWHGHGVTEVIADGFVGEHVPPVVYTERLQEAKKRRSLKAA